MNHWQRRQQHGITNNIRNARHHIRFISVFDIHAHCSQWNTSLRLQFKLQCIQSICQQTNNLFIVCLSISPLFSNRRDYLFTMGTFTVDDSISFTQKNVRKKSSCTRWTTMWRQRFVCILSDQKDCKFIFDMKFETNAPIWRTYRRINWTTNRIALSRVFFMFGLFIFLGKTRIKTIIIVVSCTEENTNLSKKNENHQPKANLSFSSL